MKKMFGCLVDIILLLVAVGGILGIIYAGMHNWFQPTTEPAHEEKLWKMGK